MNSQLRSIVKRYLSSTIKEQAIVLKDICRYEFKQYYQWFDNTLWSTNNGDAIIWRHYSTLHYDLGELCKIHRIFYTGSLFFIIRTNDFVAQRYLDDIGAKRNS